MLYSSDTILWLVAFDTTALKVQVLDQTKTLLQTIIVQATLNPYLHPEWASLPMDSTPTPLTEPEYRTFRMYRNYRMNNQPVPKFKGKTVFGDAFTEEQFKGKVTVLNFWYYGCYPCILEIPALNQLKQHYEKDTMVQFISFFMDSISVGEDKELSYHWHSKRFAQPPKALGFDFLQIPNSADIFKQFSVFICPTNMIIDQNGIIRTIKIGANEDNQEWLVEPFIRKIEGLKTQHPKEGKR